VENVPVVDSQETSGKKGGESPGSFVVYLHGWEHCHRFLFMWEIVQRNRLGDRIADFKTPLLIAESRVWYAFAIKNVRKFYVF